MASSSDNQTEETFKKLDATLEKTNSLLSTLSNQTNQIKDDVGDVEESFEGINKKGTKTVKMMDGLYNTLDKMATTADNIVSMVSGGAFITSLATIAKHSWELNNNMTALAVQMGKGREHAKVLERSVSGMMKEIGSRYEDAKNLVTTLAENKYADNLFEAAKGADLFSRATGVSAGAVAQLTTQLNKQADVSAKTSNAILAGMVKIQQKVGISRQGMEALTEHISEMASNMAAFGKSSEEIQRAAIKTTAFAGAMEKVGISAQRAVSLIEQLTDPDRIEDNILLYSQLGLSLEDAMSGGIEAAMDSGAFSEMANRIMSMGPIAGSQFAKSMGLSYKEVSRMAKMQSEEVNGLVNEAMTPEEKSLEVLKDLTAQTEGLGKTIEGFFNKIQGFLLGFGPIILTTLTVLGPKLLKLFTGLIRKITTGDKDSLQASVATGVEDGIREGLTRSGIQASVRTSLESKVPDNLRAGGLMYNVRAKGETFNVAAKKEAENSKQKHIAVLQEQRAATSQREADISYRLDYLKAKDKEKLTKNEKLDIAFLEKEMLKVQENLNKYSLALEKEGVFLDKVQEAEQHVLKANERHSSAQDKLKFIIDRENALRQKQLGATEEEYIAIQKIIDNLKVEGKTRDDLEKELKLATQEQKTANDRLAAVNRGDNTTVEDKKVNRSFLGNVASGIKTRIATRATEFKRNITEGGTLSKKQVAGKVAISGLKGLTKGIGGILKVAGPMMIVMTLIGKVMDKLREPLENLIENLVEYMDPLIKALMPIIKNVLNVLVKNLLPPLLKVLAAVLNVLHVLLTPLTGLLKGLANLTHSKTLGAIADTLDSITGPEVTGALVKAADDISKSNKDLTDKTEENTEATAAVGEEPPTIMAINGQAVMQNSGSSAVVNPTAGSTVQTTQSVSSDAEKNKEARQESNRVDQMSVLSQQAQILQDLRAQFDKSVEYLKKIADSMSTSPFKGETKLIGAQ